MRKVAVAIGFVAFVVLNASSARADTVSISFVNDPYGSAGPYVGTVDGQIANIICDDYISETYFGESWTATVSTLADVSQTKFKDVTGYEEVAWLASKELDSANAGSMQAIQ